LTDHFLCLNNQTLQTAHPCANSARGIEVKEATMNYTSDLLLGASDADGENRAVLTSLLPSGYVKGAVLYVHGFVDYFFQDHLAQAFVDAGYAFFALDLRKYGRALLPHQHPNFCADISEYYEEISESLTRISTLLPVPITLMGHSTGGLIAALYCAEGKRCDLVHSLILNSPFLEFNEPAPMRALLLPASNIIGKHWPYAVLPKGLSSLYGESLHRSKRGEWEYNLQWKPINGFPVYWGWVRAIHGAHRRLQAGLDVQIPVLLLHSDASASPSKWQENSMRADTVLNVEDMKRYGPRIGNNVTLVEVPGGMHDLFLSAQPVREFALHTTLAWLAEGTGLPKAPGGNQKVSAA